MPVTPGSIVITVTFLLSLLVTISAPNVRAFDDVRTYFYGTAAAGATATNAIDQIRFGIWGYCEHAISGGWICDSTGLAYQVAVQGAANGVTETIAKSWTRGLVMSAVATGFLFIATILSYTRHHIISALVAWFSALVTLIFMAINIALYLYVRGKMRHLGTVENTNFGPGFWMSLAVLIMSLAAGFFLLIAHRRQRTGAAEYRYGPAPGFFGRIFRRK